MSQQARSNSALLASGANVGVSNEGYVLHCLNAHYARQYASLLVATKDNAVVNLMLQFLARHVWLGPAICGNDPFVGFRAIINDCPNHVEVEVFATADHEQSASWQAISKFIRPVRRSHVREQLCKFLVTHGLAGVHSP